MVAAEWHRRVDQLPPAHAVALRLHSAGHGNEVVATALGVPVESVPALLLVAAAKLERVGSALEDAAERSAASSSVPGY